MSKNDTRCGPVLFYRIQKHGPISVKGTDDDEIEMYQSLVEKLSNQVAALQEEVAELRDDHDCMVAHVQETQAILKDRFAEFVGVWQWQTEYGSDY